MAEPAKDAPIGRRPVVDMVEAATARVEALADKLAALVSTWEKSIPEGEAPRSPVIIEKELEELESLRATVIGQAKQEAQLASDWERKAVLAIQAGREDLARQALECATAHGESRDALRAEADVVGTATRALQQLRHDRSR